MQYFGEEYYDTKILVHEGVPLSAIRILEPPILNTADEIETIKGALNTGPLRTVIIVTSKPHTRRTCTLWRLLNHGEGRAIVRAASLDPYDPVHWWRTTRRYPRCGARTPRPDKRLAWIASRSLLTLFYSKRATGLEKQEPLARTLDPLIFQFRNMRQVATFKSGLGIFDE